jgi:hypothetical protein
MKKLCCLLLISLSLITPLFGQMVLTEEDIGINPRAGKPNPGFGVMVPVQNVTYDQWNYVPLSDSLLLLVGLGGAYLLKKKRRQK